MDSVRRHTNDNEVPRTHWIYFGNSQSGTILRDLKSMHYQLSIVGMIDNKWSVTKAILDQVEKESLREWAQRPVQQTLPVCEESKFKPTIAFAQQIIKRSISIFTP